MEKIDYCNFDYTRFITVLFSRSRDFRDKKMLFKILFIITYLRMIEIGAKKSIIKVRWGQGLRIFFNWFGVLQRKVANWSVIQG